MAPNHDTNNAFTSHPSFQRPQSIRQSQPTLPRNTVHSPSPTSHHQHPHSETASPSSRCRCPSCPRDPVTRIQPRYSPCLHRWSWFDGRSSHLGRWRMSLSSSFCCCRSSSCGLLLPPAKRRVESRRWCQCPIWRAAGNGGARRRRRRVGQRIRCQGCIEDVDGETWRWKVRCPLRLLPFET